MIAEDSKPSQKGLIILFLFLPLQCYFRFSGTRTRENFSPLPPGRSFGPFDSVTKPRKVLYLLRWVDLSQIKFESSLFEAFSCLGRSLKKRSSEIKLCLGLSRIGLLPYFFRSL